MTTDKKPIERNTTKNERGSASTEDINSEYTYNSRLHKSSTNKIIAGVCGGLGDYFNIDPTIIRIIFILLTVFGGSGILIYIVLWIVMPAEGHIGDMNERSSPSDKEGIKGNMEDVKNQAKSFAHTFRHHAADDDSRFWWALLIIILGFIFLGRNLGIFEGLDLGKFWPLILIVLGLGLITRKK